jgi:hypothetical protein
MWMEICGKIGECGTDAEAARNQVRGRFDKYRVYPDSINYSDGSIFFLVLDGDNKKKLIVYREGKHFYKFRGEETVFPGGKAKICDLSSENCVALREVFAFTRPSSHKGRDATIGLGDRLGLASAGHLRVIKGKNVFPVLAQQSMRELNLTGRNYKDVLDAASWAVFQEGYTSGFGADGDHLKEPEEVKMAIDCGYTMITLDCSEHINNSVPGLSREEADKMYISIPAGERQRLESKYLGKGFEIDNALSIKYSAEEFKRIVLIYLEAIRYAASIYNNIIKNCGRPVDFEMSIDETLTPTTPESHYFVASELISGGVEIASLAPRFCGDFQKGIDYIGDVNRFTAEFDMHARIAERLGYKISVHSGSDKFSVFPVIGEKTRGRYHLKTAGTNWLEAVRVIAETDPVLYRRIHKFAVENLDAARKYYHISTDLTKIPAIDAISDKDLPRYIDMDDSRQILHITYGLILTAKNEDGSYVYRDEIYNLLTKHEEKYYKALQAHIGKHLEKLGVQ